MTIKPKHVLKLPNSWGGYTIERITERRTPYFWIGGRDGQYLLSLTKAEALKLAKFLLK